MEGNGGGREGGFIGFGKGRQREDPRKVNAFGNAFFGRGMDCCLLVMSRCCFVTLI